MGFLVGEKEEREEPASYQVCLQPVCVVDDDLGLDEGEARGRQHRDGSEWW